MSDLSVLEFRAMGSPARVVLDGNADGPLHELAASARDLIEAMEQRWSRFLPDSEVSALNRAAGNVTVVSDSTYQLIACAVRASEATGGVFNPLMLSQLETHGYQQPWQQALPSPLLTQEPAAPATLEPMVLYPEINGVLLPAGSRFDPGGIGKGLAIDTAVEHCQRNGAPSGSVEIGGDLRVFGQPWYGPQWEIAVADPFHPAEDIATFTPAEGAVTTSSIMKRTWTHQGRRLHHLLDPATGQPADTGLVAVTTCSELAWWSEVAAKAAIIAGPERGIEIMETMGTPGAAVRSDGTVITTDGRAKAGVSR